MSLVPFQPDKIARSTQEAFATLSALADLHQPPPNSEIADKTSEDFREEINRFKIWIREHDANSGRLDWKLKDTTALRDRVTALLAEISAIADEREYFDGDVQTSAQTTLDEDSVAESSPKDDSELSVLSADLSLDTDFTLPESLPDTSLARLHDLVSMLLGLGPTLADPGLHVPLELPANDDNTGHGISRVKARSTQAVDGVLEQPGKVSMPTFPIFVEVPPPTEHFYSRSNVIWDVYDTLHLPGRICIIHGVGGVGKTLAASQYSHIYKPQYDAVFWLQADTVSGLTDSFFRMARSVGVSSRLEDLPLVISQARQWLQKTGKRSFDPSSFDCTKSLQRQAVVTGI